MSFITSLPSYQHLFNIMRAQAHCWTSGHCAFRLILHKHRHYSSLLLLPGCLCTVIWKMLFIGSNWQHRNNLYFCVSVDAAITWPLLNVGGKKEKENMKQNSDLVWLVCEWYCSKPSLFMWGNSAVIAQWNEFTGLFHTISKLYLLLEPYSVFENHFSANNVLCNHISKLCTYIPYISNTRPNLTTQSNILDCDFSVLCCPKCEQHQLC